MSSGSSTAELDAAADAAGVEGDISTSGKRLLENDGIRLTGDSGHDTGVKHAHISTVQEAGMTPSPGLLQDHTVNSLVFETSTDSQNLVRYDTLTIADDLVNVLQDGNIVGSVSSEFHVNDAVVLEQRIIKEARSCANEAVFQESSPLRAALPLPRDGTEDFRVEVSDPVSAYEGMGSAYGSAYLTQDIKAQDVIMTGMFLDEEHFIFPVMDAEKEVNLWQASDDDKMEGSSLASCEAEQDATLGKNVACDDETGMGMQGPSSKCEEVPNHDSMEVVTQLHVTDAHDSILHGFTAEEMGSTMAKQPSCETKEASLNHGEPSPQRASSLAAPQESNHAILLDTSEDTSVRQVDQHKDPTCVEIAMVKSQVWIQEEDQSNEEELVEVAPEQGEDQNNVEVEEPGKEHHEVDHESSVQEGLDVMQEDEPTNEAMEKEGGIPSNSVLVLSTSSIVMSESENSCKDEEEEEEEKMPGFAGVHGDENLASQVGKMEEEKILHGRSGGESLAMQGTVLLEASKGRPTDNEHDEETQPERHEDQKSLKETSVREVEESITKPKQNGGERVEEGPSPEHFREHRFSKKPKKARNESTVFGIGDMVWAKVRSHPWWPAQIFDPADASKAARKLKKPNRALLAFFGDGTFAWLEQAQMMAFRPNFEEKVKQATMRSFCMAVEEALEEACRRSELGLRCDHYKGLLHSRNTFPNANTGIREGMRLKSRRDMPTSVHMFSPEKMLKFVKGVACSPLGSWSFSLPLLELRGHAYGVRTCIVATGDGDHTSLVKTIVPPHILKAKSTFSSLKTDGELVVGSGHKQSKRPKRVRGRHLAVEGGGSDTTMDRRETLHVLSGSKAVKTSSKMEGGSSSKVRKLSMGASKNPITISASNKAGNVRRSDSEPSTPTRTESRADDTFVSSSPCSDGEELGSKGIKKLSDILWSAPQLHAKKESSSVKDSPMKKESHEKDALRKETSKKFIKVGDSIKTLAGKHSRIPPSKHVDELLAKSSKPAPKKQKRDLASQIQSSPSKGKKAGTVDVVERESWRKAGGALKAEKPQKKGNQEVEAKVPPHRQNVPHNSEKSQVQELALAARKRKSGVLHEQVVSKAPKLTVSFGGKHASKSKGTEEGPSDQRSSFQKSSLHLSIRDDTKGSSPRLDEKLSSHLPLGLFMRFPKDFSLPSESQLKATFIPFGPLQVSATRLYKESSSAQVVFKHGRDAESAMKHAKMNALFGPVSVIYRLRHLPRFLRNEAKIGVISSGKRSSMASSWKPLPIKEREEGPRSSSQEENAQDVEAGVSGDIPITRDDMAKMPTSDMQDKLMRLLQQVSVIVNPSPTLSDDT